LAHHHPVLLIAERRGAEPQSAIAGVQMAGALEDRERVIDGAALGELAFRGPVIEAHSELGEIAADVAEHFRERQLQHATEAAPTTQPAPPPGPALDPPPLAAARRPGWQPGKTRRARGPDRSPDGSPQLL